MWADRRTTSHAVSTRRTVERLQALDVGIEMACKLTGKSKATLGRYYADHDEHAERFMPVDAVAALEQQSSYPHVTSALAELNGITLSFDQRRDNETRKGGVNSDVVALSQRFAMLMAEYHQSIEDGVISANEARRLLRETSFLRNNRPEPRLVSGGAGWTTKS